MFILTYTLNQYIKHNRTLTTYTRICLKAKGRTFYLFNNISSISITLIFDIHDGPFDNLQTLNFQIGWYNNLAFDIANCHSVLHHTSIESVNETWIYKKVAFFSLNTQLCNYLTLQGWSLPWNCYRITIQTLTRTIFGIRQNYKLSYFEQICWMCICAFKFNMKRKKKFCLSFIEISK